MWTKQAKERELAGLLSQIERSPAATKDLVLDILARACPRYQAAHAVCRGDAVTALIAAGAFVELALRLIELELPDWSIHRLSRDDTGWSCTVCVQGLAMNWIDDFVEFQHEKLGLALYGALIQAQMRKSQGTAPSNVVAFRSVGADDIQYGRR